MKVEDLTGKRFGSLTVISRAENYKDGSTMWNCKCDCGATTTVKRYSLISGHTKSCGCSYKLDLTGKRFGRLKALNFITKNSMRYWECECKCGKIIYVPTHELTHGQKSCGCWNRELTSISHTKHSGSCEKLYKAWHGMIERCEKPYNTSFKNYGGRGIKVCEEWHEYSNFRKWAYDNGYPEYKSLDRIDVNGNYCPENCRYTDAITQANNTRTNRIISFNGEKHTLAQWARKVGISADCISLRLDRYGYTVEEALTKPSRRILCQ